MSESPTHATATAFRQDIAGERRIAGVSFVVAAAQFMIAIMLAAAMAPGYTLSETAISDLGVIQETALLFNASLVVAGILNLVGGYYFYRTHRHRGILAVFAIAAVGAAGAGIFPLDTGGLHSLAALLAFVFFNLEALASATRTTGVMRIMSVVAGLAGLAFVVVMSIGDAGNPAVFGPIGHGGAERMIVYPVMLWLVAFGGYLLAPPPEQVPNRDGEVQDSNG